MKMLDLFDLRPNRRPHTKHISLRKENYKEINKERTKQQNKRGDMTNSMKINNPINRRQHAIVIIIWNSYTVTQWWKKQKERHAESVVLL